MKKIFVALCVVLLLIPCLYLICRPAALPTSDLASPSQEVRDAAAKILRAHAKPTWKIKWWLLTSHIKIGETETNILELLHSYKLKPEPGIVMGGLGEYAEYQLDYYWTLGCEYNNNDYKRLILEKWKLIPGWSAVGIWPTTNFSGVWITYYANGQKFYEGNFTNGLRHGEHTTFTSDGSKSSVWHYDHDKANGLWTQYFPSGKVQIQCEYSNYARIGDRVWYYEDGSKQSTEYYENGKLNGLLTVYFPSGKIKSQCQYSNSTRVGIEIKYNEDGTTNSVTDYSHL